MSHSLRPSSPAVDAFIPPRSRVALGFTVALIGVVITGASFWGVRQAENSRVSAEFGQRAQRAVFFLSRELQRHEDLLHATRAVLQAAPQLDRAAFSQATRELVAGRTGVRALEWAERVPESRRDTVEAALQREGFSEFVFRRRVSSNQLIPMERQAEYMPVLFIEPLAGNEPALGFDLRTGQTWPVLDRIAATGELAASGRLRLLSPDDKPRFGYIMELPVYARPHATASADERRAMLRGYVLGIFEIGDTIEAYFSGAPASEDILEVLFMDRSATGADQVIHFHSRDRVTDRAAPTLTEFQRGLHRRVPFNHAGRAWELWIRPRQDWVALHVHSRSWLMLALGLVITGSGATFVIQSGRRERLVGRMVAHRTAQLRATQAELERDIAARCEAERQLASLLGQLPGAAFRCRYDEKLSAIFVSDGMQDMTGVAPAEFIAGRTHVIDVMLPEDVAAARTLVDLAVKERRAFEVEFRVRDRAGAIRWVLARGRAVYAADGALRFIEGLAIDVTARKAAEASKLAFERKLLEAQKLESLGVLAGGVAHDFNNLLTAMLANAGLVRYALPAGSPAIESVANIEEAARRAAELCQQMLAYARKKELRAKPMDLGELVRSTATLLRVGIPRNARLEAEVEDGLPPVFGDGTQLHQIVMNLVLNAADAIGERPGRIAVRVYSRDADTAFLRTSLQHPDLPGGRYVVLEVKDDGCGMTPEVLGRIFEPFFTTKFTGRGLGLAAVFGIVQTHRGALFVESAVGQGSTFRLFLRAYTGAAEVPEKDPVKQGLFKGTALVVDDESVVRDVLATVLRRIGMTPLKAATGDEALAIYEEQRSSVDLVLLDVMMPGRSGEETLRSIRERNPRQRVLMMSGYTEDDTVARCRTAGASDFIPKPFDVAGLVEKLRGALT